MKKINAFASIIALALIVLSAFAFKPLPEPTPPPDFVQKISTLSAGSVYKVSVDGIQYIVVTQGATGVAITKHE